MKVSLLSLGCPRNLVDSEVILGALTKDGFEIVEDIASSEAAIINTCSFIKDAKLESIEVILQALKMKQDGLIKYVVVAGCLPERYRSTLLSDFSEVDAFVGAGDLEKFSGILRRLALGKKNILEVSKKNHFLYDHKTPRMLLTPAHFAYIKISEGCLHKCSFCAIPFIRGPFRSRRLDSVLKEAKYLVKKRRVSEINIIGQDTTAYGLDLYKRPMLSELLKKISCIKEKFWLRVLYTHPKFMTEEFIKTFKENEKLLRYIDLPIQHINDRILKLMQRGITKAYILKLLDKLRKNIPGAAIRTSVIVGFPSETDKDFKELLDFLKDARFERLGAFLYSREEATRAALLKKQTPQRIARERFETLMKLQQDISKENNKKFLGKEIEVLIDSKESDNLTYIGRTFSDAPEVDGEVFVTSKRPISSGEFAKVFITGCLEYDLIGEAI